MWSAIINWGIGQFTKNFGGGNQEGSIMDRVIDAGASALSDKFLDTDSGGGSPRHRQVNLGITQASTYAMSDSQAPETPEVVDHSAVEAKWTRIAKKLSEIQDTSSRIG